MAYFDRFDICCAYQALEYDWNRGGILQERASCARRCMSVGFQLARMGFKPAGDEAAGFGYLVRGDNSDNRGEIYVQALVRMGLSHLVEPGDEIAQFAKGVMSREEFESAFSQVVRRERLEP